MDIQLRSNNSIVTYDAAKPVRSLQALPSFYYSRGRFCSFPLLLGDAVHQKKTVIVIVRHTPSYNDPALWAPIEKELLKLTSSTMNVPEAEIAAHILPWIGFVNDPLRAKVEVNVSQDYTSGECDVRASNLAQEIDKANLFAFHSTPPSTSGVCIRTHAREYFCLFRLRVQSTV